VGKKVESIMPEIGKSNPFGFHRLPAITAVFVLDEVTAVLTLFHGAIINLVNVGKYCQGKNKNGRWLEFPVVSVVELSPPTNEIQEVINNWIFSTNQPTASFFF
jgi:hypothetical protein